MQTTGNTSLFFLYDSNGLIGFDKIESGTTTAKYYYQIDGKGEIVGITDTAGNVVAKYTYDAWGNPISITNANGSTITGSNEIGIINPFRYKSYYYDTDTGLYYLNSRYYDPQVCRFVSADAAETLVEDLESVLQYNLFTYCFNNPVNMIDDSGTWPNWAKVLVGAVATAAAVAVTVATGGAVLPILAGVVASTACGALTGYLTDGKQGAIDGAADGFMLGGISSLATAAVGAVKTVTEYKKTIDTYSSLTKQYKGSGMEAHHIIEQRLAKGSSWKASKMPSVELTKEVHKGYTNAWRKQVAYGTKYNPTISYKFKLYKAASTIYKGNRVLNMAARYTIMKM